MMRKSLSLVASVGLVTLLYGASSASAQAVAPSLGTAAPYTVLGTNTVPTVGTVTCTNTTGSTIDGNVGTTFSSITNTGCTITGSTDAPVNGSVVTDFNAALAAVDTLNPVCDGVIPTATATLAPGVYCSAAGTTIGTGVTLTLNGTASDVWVFRVGTGGLGALALTGTTVTMAGTALACNVYWKTAEAATATDSTFVGTVLSGAGVTMTRGSWSGRALAKTDATVTNAAPLTFAGCSPPVRPTVTKAFSPVSIAVGGVSTLTITLNNPNAAGINLNALFTDTLPGGVLVAAVPNLATTCGGLPTATAGGSTVTLATGSTIPASGSCTIKVDVTAAAAGSYTNTILTNDLKTNTGTNLNPASAILTATALLPTVTKAFSPASITAGDASRLTITLSNTNATAIALTAAFIDTLPSGVLVAPAPNPTTTCGVGAVAAPIGGSTVTLPAGSTIPAGSCTIAVNVTAAAAGSYTNTILAGDLKTTPGNNAAPATAILAVVVPAGSVPPTVTKAFSPSSNGPGGISTLTITLTNANATAATLTAPLVDTLPAGVVIAPSPNASTTCGGTVTAAAGGSSITLSQAGSTIPAGGSCTVIANVTSAATGTFTNTIAVNALQTVNGSNTVPGTATLTIAAIPPVPTLSEWAMIMLAALLCLSGFFAIRRRRLTN